MPKLFTENTLFYGDNLPILQEYLCTESIDLIYLDPPFNSKRDYMVFKEEDEGESTAPLRAFKDTWPWDAATQATFEALCLNASLPLKNLLQTFYDLLGPKQLTAYLVMMTPRLVELHRILKPTGSLYLHCDSTASHYLKLLLDGIFGTKNFRNEIVWKRTSAHNNTKTGFGKIHDRLLYYAKDIRLVCFNQVFEAYNPAYLAAEFKQDEQGRWYKVENLTAPAGGGTGGRFCFRGRTPGPSRRWSMKEEELERLWQAGRIKKDQEGRPLLRGHIVYLEEKKGRPLQDWWDDLLRVGNTAKERLGYPTQKPLALLERILQASSNAGDWILDPFCGCGTTLVAAQKLQRNWVGIELNPQTATLHQKRLADLFGLFPQRDYAIKGFQNNLGQ